MMPMEVKCLRLVGFSYKNWRGETSSRRAIFHCIFYGATVWHPEPQWIVEASDISDPGEAKTRQFAMRDMSEVVYEP